MTAPWWVTADADATYTASGLNLLLGNHTEYLDHPGLPEQEALEGIFGAQYLTEKAIGTRSSGVNSFAADTLLHLDRARPVYRTVAIALYLLGVALVFLVLTRLLGHWTWGFAGSMLWFAAPGLLDVSTQIRPDVLLCALVVLSGYLVVRAADQRDPWLFVLASASIGFASMVKLHAMGVAPVLLAAVVWRHPPLGWLHGLTSSARTGIRRHRRWLAPLLAGLLAVAIAFNLNRPAFMLTTEQKTFLLTALALVGGYAVCALTVSRFHLIGANRIFDPFLALVVIALLAGLAIPLVFDPEDGIQALLAIKHSLTGHGAPINSPPSRSSKASSYSPLRWPESSSASCDVRRFRSFSARPQLSSL